MSKRTYKWVTLLEFKNACKEAGLWAGSEESFEIAHEEVERAIEARQAKQAKKEPAPTQKFIAAYWDEFQVVHGAKPDVAGRNASAAKRMVTSLGLDEAIELMRTYLVMPNAFFREQCHPLWLMETNLNKIKVAHQTGKVMTRSAANREDRRTTTRQAVVNAAKRMGVDLGRGKTR